MALQGSVMIPQNIFISFLFSLDTGQGQGHCVQAGGSRTQKGESDTWQGGVGQLNML